MSDMQRRLAHLIRRAPFLIRIVHFLYSLIQPRYKIGVIGVVFNDQQQVLLVNHVFHPYLSWGLPGGWIGRNEDPALAVKRELEEELELQVDVKQTILVEKTSYYQINISYLCHAHNDVGKLSYELLGYDWYNLADLPRLYPFHSATIQRAHALIEQQQEIR